MNTYDLIKTDATTRDAYATKVIADLMDANYKPTEDAQTGEKMAAIRRLIERVDELETAVSCLAKACEGMSGVIGRVL